MKNIQDVQNFIGNKSHVCLLFDYEGVLSSYSHTFSADSFNPMMKRVLENYAKKEYIKVVILLPEKNKKILKKLKMNADNLEFCPMQELDIPSLYNNMNEKMRLVYFGNNLSVATKIKEAGGTVVCIESISEEVKALMNFSVTKGRLEEFIMHTNNLYL
ncbi:MAG: hypothetical protein PHF89_04850 [Eubacteriales bacterium]|nr:hypothetical protein [Eubacteriales bacterium]